MNNKFASNERIVERAAEIAASVLAPQAEEVDREARWPAHSFSALADAGLMGLLVPRDCGGLGGGFELLAMVTETLAQACSSSAICYAMHCVGSKVLASKATDYQRETFLIPIAEGKHITTLALSEPGTGAHFYLPQVTFRLHSANDSFLINGTKSFVTNGGYADSLVISSVAEGREFDPGTFSCLVVDGKSQALQWSPPWDGFGMRGNSSRNVEMRDFAVPTTALLGAEGDENWYLFEIIAPFFLVAMAATYSGVMRAAIDAAIEHLRGRHYTHTRKSVGAEPIVTHRLGEIFIRSESARQFVFHAARSADAGTADARAAILSSKALVADTAVAVTNEVLTLIGGKGYAANHRAARLLRDARASHVMAPTTDLLKNWLGRTLLDMPCCERQALAGAGAVTAFHDLHGYKNR